MQNTFTMEEQYGTAPSISKKKVSPTEALSELLALHKREMHDGTITLKEWQTAIKKAEQSLESEKANV